MAKITHTSKLREPVIVALKKGACTEYRNLSIGESMEIEDSEISADIRQMEMGGYVKISYPEIKVEVEVSVTIPTVSVEVSKKPEIKKSKSGKQELLDGKIDNSDSSKSKKEALVD